MSSWRNPFSRHRSYLRPPKGALRPGRARRSQIPKFRMRPTRRVEMAAAMSSPEERSSRPNLRLTLVGLIVLGLFALLGLRLWSLQVVNYKAYAAAVNGNTLRIASVTAPRGDIVDRNDTVIVGNVTQQEIVLSRAEATQHPESIGQVAALVGETPQQVETDLNNPQYSPYEPVPVLKNAPASTVQYLEAHQEQYPGVSVQSVTVRSYPQGGTTANQVLGYVSPITGQELSYLQKADPSGGYSQSSQIGQTGLENEYESYLKGTDGKQYLEVNAKGNVVGTLKTVQPTQGDTLVSNVDLGLQQAAEQALANDMNADRQTPDPTTHQNPGATNGAAIVMDVNTGAVLAMASYPNTNDLNNWVGGISNAAYQALEAPCQTKDPNAGCPLINYAIQGRYTPGSTFKLNTATAALQDGLITPDTLLQDNGSYTIPDCTGQCTFHDADAGAQGSINVTTALTVSSDVFFYQLGDFFWSDRGTYGSTAIQDVAAQYSLGQLTGIDLPNEVAGQVDSQALDNKLYAAAPQDYDKVTWTAGYNLEMAFGQGATVITPIEQAVAYSTFANGGTRYQPLLGAAVVSQDGKVVKTIAPKVAGHVTISPTNYAAMLKGFEGVVNDPSGTAYGTFQADATPAVHAMNLGGKTGTADVQTGEPNAWFVSFGPNPNPKYVVLAVVAQGGYGAQAAAPAVAQIWNYLAANPPGQVQIPTATKQPSTTAPATNPVPTPATTTTSGP